MDRQASFRLEMRAGLAAGQRCKRDSLKKGPGPGLTHFSDVDAACGRQHRIAHEAADPALVGAHAMRCITLHVFDVLVALASSQTHIGAGHIMLQVDKRLAFACDLPARFKVSPGRIGRGWRQRGLIEIRKSKGHANASRC
jgi:hypothetical protein